jgi:prepilin-type processing-associated H-X9-DG protein
VLDADDKWGDGDAFDARYPWHFLRYGPIMNRDAEPTGDADRCRHWGSAHPGGVNVVFVDGHVQILKWNVDTAIFGSLLDRRDGAGLDLDLLN